MSAGNKNVSGPFRGAWRARPIVCVSVERLLSLRTGRDNSADS